MVVRPNAEAAKTPAPQCDLSPIWNLWENLEGCGMNEAQTRKDLIDPAIEKAG